MPSTWMMKASAPRTCDRAPSHPRPRWPPPCLPGCLGVVWGARGPFPPARPFPGLQDPSGAGAAALPCRERVPGCSCPGLARWFHVWELLTVQGRRCWGPGGGDIFCNCILSPQVWRERQEALEARGGLWPFLRLENVSVPFDAAQIPQGRAGRHQPAAAHSGDSLQLPLTVTDSLLPTQGFISNLLGFNDVFFYTCGSC